MAKFGEGLTLEFTPPRDRRGGRIATGRCKARPQPSSHPFTRAISPNGGERAFKKHGTTKPAGKGAR